VEKLGVQVMFGNLEIQIFLKNLIFGFTDWVWHEKCRMLVLFFNAHLNIQKISLFLFVLKS